MKHLLVIAAICFASIANAGREGNGGSDLALDFHQAAAVAIKKIYSVKNVPPLSAEDLERVLDSTRLIVTQRLLHVGSGGLQQEVVAKNFQGPKRIVINETKWRSINSTIRKQALALHEVLSLAGLEGTGDYHISQRYEETMSADTPREFDMLTKPLALNAPENPIVTIVEFADFQSPFDMALAKKLAKVTENYGSKVQVVVRNYPLTVIHEHARSAALAGICASFQGRFKEMHDRLFANYDQLSDEKILSEAGQIEGLSPGQFKVCLSSPEARARLDIDLSFAKDLRLESVPVVLISRTFSETVRVDGVRPYEEYQVILDRLLLNQ